MNQSKPSGRRSPDWEPRELAVLLQLRIVIGGKEGGRMENGSPFWVDTSHYFSSRILITFLEIAII